MSFNVNKACLTRHRETEMRPLFGYVKDYRRISDLCRVMPYETVIWRQS